MLFVRNLSLDPWFNIAAEEYLLKHLDREIIMLWRSNPSIIVGKHQNTLAEINLEYVRKNDIPVVRRLSGGGTVFHDPGNINFTFIKNANKENLINFRSHTQPVIDFLQSLGVDARFEGKNDLRVNGLKISGNAEHIHKDKVLHHGTLLFDANLDHLNEAIKAKEELFESKAVKSLRSTVVNISRFLSNPMTCDDFIEKLRSYFFRQYPSLEQYDLKPDDIRAISRIREEKYIKWEWNFGWSPVYTFKNRIKFRGNDLLLEMRVNKGKIEFASMIVNGDKLAENDSFISGLKDIKHKPEEIGKLLAETDFYGFNTLNDPWQMLGLFF
ncbi:MAG: lipoate--protein ligase [Bacteroidales bacterium]|nr:lipoate--protein ligase [Bacteroidales bacterium]